MKHLGEIKEQLGSCYSFHRLLSEQEVKSLQACNPAGFEMQTAAILVAGCVKIEIALYKKNGAIRTGYDVFVKDCAESPEWICYDSPDDMVSFREADIFDALDRVVETNGLSYTECRFERMDGETVKPKVSLKI